jgi:hypothetical protein
MEIREVRVECRKLVSDGAYGNEQYSVALTATIDEEATWNESAHRLATQAYDIVLAHLKTSRSDGVRDALETREEREARWDHEREALRQGQVQPAPHEPIDQSENPFLDAAAGTPQGER